METIYIQRRNNKKYIADNGICCAKFIKTIDCDSLEKKIRDDFDVTWACMVKGSRSYSLYKGLFYGKGRWKYWQMAVDMMIQM